MQLSLSDVTSCAQRVEQGDPLRFKAVMSARADQRVALFVLYAFHVEVTRAPWAASEPMIAEMRLQWWWDALEGIATGGVVRSHDVTVPLAHILSPDQARLLQRLVDARRWDCYKEAHSDADALTFYLHETGAPLMQVAEEITAGQSAVGADVGYALAVANYLQAIPALEAAGRVPLVDGRVEAVQDLAQGAWDRWQRAKRHKGTIGAAALRGAWQVPLILPKVIKNPKLVARGLVAPNPLSSALRLARVGAFNTW